MVRVSSVLLSTLAAVAAAAASLGSVPQASVGAGRAGRFVEHTVQARALEGNLLGDPTRQPVLVYLPPGYETGSRRYPTVYFFHGFSDSHSEWGPRLGPVLDRLIGEGRLPPTIFVLPNGRNAYLSTYFTNSPVTGRWEDYVVQDLVPEIDRHFRTLPRAASRGISGYSKGGFVALRLSMRHPDVFGAAYGISPCCLSLPEAVRVAPSASWRKAAGFASRQEFDDFYRRFEANPEQADFFTIGIVALAAAISPNPRHPPLFVDLPFESKADGLHPLQPTLDLWEAASPIHEVPHYARQLKTLGALGIEVGADDGFKDIPPSVKAFADALTRAGVRHTVDVYDGRHEDKIIERLPDHMLPFFARALKR